MAKLNLNSPSNGGGGDHTTIPTDIYTMTIAKADLELDQYGKKDDQGNPTEEKLVIRWEVVEEELTEEQIGEGVLGGEPVWWRVNPWYGITKNGAPSKFKEFLDSLAEQKLIELDLDDFDTDTLVGIRQKVMIEERAKTMGPNAGKMGNYVKAVKPLKRQAKNRPMVDDSDIPFGDPKPTPSAPEPADCGPVEEVDATITAIKRTMTAQGQLYRISLDTGIDIYTSATNIISSLREVELPHTCTISYRSNPTFGPEMMGFREVGTELPF